MQLFLVSAECISFKIEDWCFLIIRQKHTCPHPFDVISMIRPHWPNITTLEANATLPNTFPNGSWISLPVKFLFYVIFIPVIHIRAHFHKILPHPPAPLCFTTILSFLVNHRITPGTAKVLQDACHADVLNVPPVLSYPILIFGSSSIFSRNSIISNNKWGDEIEEGTW